MIWQWCSRVCVCVKTRKGFFYPFSFPSVGFKQFSVGWQDSGVSLNLVPYSAKKCEGCFAYLGIWQPWEWNEGIFSTRVTHNMKLTCFNALTSSIESDLMNEPWMVIEILELHAIFLSSLPLSLFHLSTLLFYFLLGHIVTTPLPLRWDTTS